MLRLIAVVLPVSLIACVSTRTIRPLYGPQPVAHSKTPFASTALPSPQLPAAPTSPPAPGRIKTNPGAAGDARVLTPPSQAAAAEEQPPTNDSDLCCVLGPPVLQRVDEMEREGQAAAFEFNGAPATAEEIAGRLIAGCVEQLQEITPAAYANDATLRGSVEKWKVNLAFMQSWLRNRMAAPADPE